MLCWEGYDADPITGRFNRDFDLQLQAETLLCDAAIADERLAGRHPDSLNASLELALELSADPFRRSEQRIVSIHRPYQLNR
jgi:hypothetical protein